jgi:hypothetical protein
VVLAVEPVALKTEQPLEEPVAPMEIMVALMVGMENLVVEVVVLRL